VNKIDLDEKMARVTELQVKVDDLTVQNDFALKLKDISHQDHLKKLEEEHRAQVEAMKIKYDLLLQEKTDREDDASEKMQRTEDRYSHEKHVRPLVLELECHSETE
jgi:hypothetical protein